MQQEIIKGFQASPQQRRFWSLPQSTATHRAQCVVSLEGQLNPPALRDAVRRVVERHEVLRTRYVKPLGLSVPLLTVDEQAVFDWVTVDLTASDPAARTAASEEALRRERTRDAAIDREPPLRVCLIALSERKHLLSLALPSVSADAWTLDNLVSEISREYGADAEADAPSEESLQYAQFAEWQNELLEEEEESDPERERWKAAAFAALGASGLGLGKKPSTASHFKPRTVELRLEPEAASWLQLLSERYGVGVSVCVMSIWQTLLWRLGVGDDVVVGDVCAGREYEELHGAMGLFARWVPVACRFRPGLRFADVVAQVEKSTRESYEWQEYFSFERGASPADASPADEAHPPAYFYNAFEYRRRPAPCRAGDVTFNPAGQHVCAEPFELKLDCLETGAEPEIKLQYNSETFTPAEAGRVAGHFLKLLESVVRGAETTVSRLEILNEAERERLLHDFNETHYPAPQNQTLHQLFEEQAARTPEALAVVYGNQSLTFAELNTRANRLARRLAARGVVPEARVGLCMERSASIIVGLLGILKAGGAYVPLDPASPERRLAYMLEDAQAALVVTEEHLLPRLSALPQEKICPGGDEAWDGGNPEVDMSAGNLAYVIYTSGSTGQPKGVVVEHRSVVNLSHALRQAVYAGERTALRVSLNAPLTFDASVKQFLQLVGGHSLCILDDETRLDPSRLLSYAEGHALDVLDCTPSQLRVLLDAGLAERPRPRLLLVGGEAFDAELWGRAAAHPHARFYNVYGPTECTVDSTVCRVEPATTQPTIGRAVANAQVYILDEHLNPAPVGVVGEIYIGGAGLARGYLNRPELTAESFVPNPFSTRPGERLYRSGDEGRFAEDGSVEYAGRRDQQLKVRGFRVEAGEIEAALAGHEEVREAAVAAQDAAYGEKRLSAYLVLKSASRMRPAPRLAPSEIPARALAADEWRSFLKERLPDYMLPSTFVEVERMPLTRNGKIDRRALAALNVTRAAQDMPYAPPQTSLEQSIAGIWQEVLKLERVGVDDNFFDLGGHSLLAAQVHNKLLATLDREVSIVEIFEYPTVRLLAQHLSDAHGEEQSLRTAYDRAAKQREAINLRRQSMRGEKTNG